MLKCFFTVLSAGDPSLNRFVVYYLHWKQALDAPAEKQLGLGQVKALDWRIPVMEECS